MDEEELKKEIESLNNTVLVLTQKLQQAIGSLEFATYLKKSYFKGKKDEQKSNPAAPHI